MKIYPSLVLSLTALALLGSAAIGCKKAPPQPAVNGIRTKEEFQKMQKEANAFLDKLQATPKEKRPALLKASKDDMRKIMSSPDPSLQMRLSRIMSGQADEASENGEEKQ